MEFKRNVSRERLLSEVLNNFEEITNSIEKDPNSILDAWKNKSRLLGEKIKIEDDGKSKVGIFEDLDEMGFIIFCILLNVSLVFKSSNFYTIVIIIFMFLLY